MPVEPMTGYEEEMLANTKSYVAALQDQKEIMRQAGGFPSDSEVIKKKIEGVRARMKWDGNTLSEIEAYRQRIEELEGQ